MTDRHSNPVDYPCAWVREETLSHQDLDDCTLSEAVIRAPRIFVHAVRKYEMAVRKQDQRLAAGVALSTRTFGPVTDADAKITDGTVDLPTTLVIANGPGFTLALIARHNIIDVVDIGMAGL